MADSLLNFIIVMASDNIISSFMNLQVTTAQLDEVVINFYDLNIDSSFLRLRCTAKLRSQPASYLH